MTIAQIPREKESVARMIPDAVESQLGRTELRGPYLTCTPYW